MRVRKRMIFFGSIGIARKILEEIILAYSKRRNGQEIELLGVCCEKQLNGWRKEESVYDFAVKNRLRILDLEEIPGLSPDLGVSVRYNRLISKTIIDTFHDGIVNTHGGILPEYRGSYCNINALINGESEYGVTLHYIQPGVDDGDIVDIRKIPIMKDDTGLDLYHASERMCYELIQDNIDSLLDGTNKRISQAAYIRDGHECGVYRRETTLEKKDLTGIETDDPLWIRTVRAFDSPFHEPAFIRVGNSKVFLRYRYDTDETDRL